MDFKWSSPFIMLTLFSVCKEKCMVNKKKKKKKKKQVILSALRLLDCAFTGCLSTLYKCLLTTMVQDIPFHEIPLIRDCCNHKESCTPVSLCVTIISRTISSELLVQGNFKHIWFSQEHWYWRDSNSQPLAPQASALRTQSKMLAYTEETGYDVRSNLKVRWGLFKPRPF